MKIIGVIPARYASSRFPGKPLAGIHDKPMLWYVWSAVKRVAEIDCVYIATDDERIASVAIAFGAEVVLTDSAHHTGTDRVAEVAEKFSADVYVNIQGDEPMLEPETIRAALLPFTSGENVGVVNLMTKITNPVDAINPTVPKVIASEDGRGVYLTRSLSPFPKGSIDYTFYKQVCVYGFTADELRFYKTTPRGKVERIEDIEILRFIEHGHSVKFVEVDSNTVAVDTENDLKKVRTLIPPPPPPEGVV